LSASEPSSDIQTPEYYEHNIWPFLIAMAIGVAMFGLFMLMKGFVFPAALLLMLSFCAVIGGFLYSETKNWRSSILTAFGGMRGGIDLGPFPVDINLTIQLIILTEILLFGGAFAMYFGIRLQFPFWPPAGAPVLDTSIAKVQTLFLISSSILAEWSIWKLRKGNDKAFRFGLIGTTILGGFFPVLQFGLEWPHLILNHILTPSTGFFGASFYLLTGIHGAHVTAGVIAYCYADIRAFMGQYTAKNHGFIDAAVTYWQFVDLIWVLLFALMWQGTWVLSV